MSSLFELLRTIFILRTIKNSTIFNTYLILILCLCLPLVIKKIFNEQNLNLRDS